jgi:hypothetical protein
MDKKRLGLWAPMFVLAAALVMLAVSTGEVEAGGRGKGGGKPGGGTTSAATLTVPATVVAYEYFTVSGAGFSPGATVGVTVTNDWLDVVTADGSGAFSYQKRLRILGPATFTANVQQGKDWVVKATAATVVVSP